MKRILKIMGCAIGMMCMLITVPANAQRRYFSDTYNCNDYRSFDLRLVNFNEKGEKYIIANDSRMEIILLHKGERIHIAAGGESKVFNGKATQVFDNCNVTLDGYPVENYNQYIAFQQEYSNKLSHLEGGHDYTQGMYGVPDTRNPQNLAKGIEIAKKLIGQFEVLEKEIQGKIANKGVSKKFEDQDYLGKLKYRARQCIDNCKRVMNNNEQAINSHSKANADLGQQTTSKSNASNNNTSSNSSTNTDFWGNGSSTTNAAQSHTASAGRTTGGNNDNVRGASSFAGGLDDIKEGEYFADDKGNHYQKRQGNAHKVDKDTYDRHQANKIYKQMERQEAERQQRDAEFKQNWDQVSTSFYMMSAAKEGLRDASYLGSNFETIEELNAAFSQQMREISVMASELQQSSTQGVQAYAQMIGTGSSGYDYSGYSSAIGGIAAAIGANKAEKDAREELKRQRDEAEAEIKTRQLKALVAMRTEISNVFIEGGMPLSSHKISAPVLYMFAYNSNKADWNKDQSVPMSISNVIPVYRYSDGTYPYTSNVKRTFESAGMSNPIIIGYFTDQEEAEGYRSSLLEIAPEAKFAVKDVEVQVKERSISAQSSTSSEVDFWGTKSSGEVGSKSIPTKAKEKEVDFWGMPVKDNATNKKSLETKKAEPNKEKQKEVDFWGR